MRETEQVMLEEQAIGLQRDLGREALGLAADLVSILDQLSRHAGLQDHQNTSCLVADAQWLAEDMKVLLECFDGDPIARIRDLLAWSRREDGGIPK